MTRPWLLAAALTLTASLLPAATYVVSTTADDGPGSLRQGILDANSGACALPCSIAFASGSGVMRIEPLSPLPALTATRAQIAAGSWTVELSGAKVSAGDGLTLRCNDCVVRVMIINGFPGSGIAVEGGKATIGANVIGLDATGKQAVPNLRHGVSVTGGTEIAINDNTIGGNGGDGVHAEGVTSLFLGLNHIGDQHLPQGSGDAHFPNGGAGIFLRDVANGYMAFNVIANNAGAGVVVTGQTSRVRIQARGLASRIFDNGGLPIDLGADGVTPNGPNGLQNRPVLTVADVSNGFLRVLGEVTAASNTSVDVNVFASDRVGIYGIADAERPVYDAKVTTDANGLAQFEFRFPLPSDVGNWISATATTDRTSELSAPLQAAVSNQNYVVMTTADSGPGSLRQAILDANAGICSADFPCRIEFDLPPPLPAAGYYTIAPLTPLPPITRSGITVDGTSPPRKPREYATRPARIEISGRFCAPGAGLTIAATTAPVIGASIRNLAINGFHGDGIVIDGGADPLYILDPVINSNLIGTDPTGTAAVPNAGAGVRVRGVIPFQHFGTFGSGNRFEGNLISGNGSHGVLLESGFFEFEGNAIGTDITRRLPLGNGGAGLHVAIGARSHLEGNMLAFNGKAGVSIADSTLATFNGVIQSAIHSNVGLGIDLRDDGPSAFDFAPRNPPEIATAVYDPATKETTVTVSFGRTMDFSSWLPVIDFFVSSFPEAGGRGSGEKAGFYHFAGPAKDEGGGRFTLNTVIRGVDLGGMRIAATATPFSYQGWKLPPIGTIFGQGFVYGTTSELSRAIPVVTAGCPSEQPRLLAPAADDHLAAGPVELRWTTVAGATAYNVWLRRPGDVRHLAANTAGASAMLALPPGRTAVRQLPLDDVGGRRAECSRPPPPGRREVVVSECGGAATALKAAAIAAALRKELPPQCDAGNRQPHQTLDQEQREGRRADPLEFLPP